MRITQKRIITLILALSILTAMMPVAAANQDSYQNWKQYDPRWGSVVLTNKTMKQVGCLATSVAMLAVRAGLRGGDCFDPGVFACEMKKAGGFNWDDDLVWEAIPKAVPGLTAETPWARLDGAQAEKTAQLKGYLDKGYQVAVAVKHGGHWVALRSVAGGRAVMMDPGSTATDLFAKYPAAGVTRVALLRADESLKPKEESTMTESVVQFLKDMGSLLLEIFKYFYSLGK